MTTTQLENEHVQQSRGRLDFSQGCPKCHNRVIREGGVRAGEYADDLLTCPMCGLTNESYGWWDAVKQMRVEG